MKKLARKKWIWIVSAAAVVLAVAAVFAWKYLRDRGPEVPKLAAVPIDEEHFPDRSFRQYVSLNYDLDGDGILSGVERWKVKECSPTESKIEDLKGIEYFPRLRDLYCGRNKLKSLDVSQNTELQRLECEDNNLKSLDVSQNTKLLVLYCGVNILESLDVSRNTKLKRLECAGNDLKSLDVSRNIDLESLDCHINILEILNVTGCVHLKYLDCENNNLSSLDLSTCVPAIEVSFSKNPMTEQDIIYNPLRKD